MIAHAARNKRFLTGLSVLSVVLTLEPVSAEVPSRIGTSARESKAKVIKHVEEVLSAATERKNWLETLEVIRLLSRLDPQNPQAVSTKEPATKAFLSRVLKDHKSKSLRKLRDDYLRALRSNLKSAQKKKDILGIFESTTLLLELHRGNEKLRDAKERARTMAEKIAREKIADSALQQAARRAREGYLRGLTRALKRHQGKKDIMATLESAKLVLEIDSSNRDAKAAWEESSAVILGEVMAKARKRAKPMPFVKRSEALLENYAKNLERKLKAAKAKRDPLGILEASKLILEVKPDNEGVKELQEKARRTLLTAASALGRALREEDLSWYKIEGKYAFDGAKVMFNTGVLAVGQMTNNVIITGYMKARHPHLAYGWGVQKKWNSPAGSDERLDGKRWVRFAVVATPHVGFWSIEDKVYRPSGCEYTGRLIVYPRGQVELKDVRIYKLK